MDRYNLIEKTFSNLDLDLLSKGKQQVIDNLIIEFKNGSSGGKLSYCGNSRFKLTIFFNGYKELCDTNRIKQTFIHEYIHYLDLKDKSKTELEQIKMCDFSNLNLYYNNQYEFNAYLNTFLFNLLNSSDDINLFDSKEQTILLLRSNKSFPKEFFSYLTLKNRNQFIEKVYALFLSYYGCLPLVDNRTVIKS